MSDERETRLFPDKDQEDQRITCHDMTPEFLIYGTDVSLLQKSILFQKNNIL
jgi:WD repeat-containing protein 19